MNIVYLCGMFNLVLSLFVKCVSITRGVTLKPANCCFTSLAHQEMLAIMKSIYDMMGRYTYPCVRDEAPSEHVDKFFQVFREHK